MPFYIYKDALLLAWQSKLLSCPQWSSSCVCSICAQLWLFVVPFICVRGNYICSELMDSLDKNDDIIYCNANAETSVE